MPANDDVQGTHPHKHIKMLIPLSHFIWHIPFLVCPLKMSTFYIRSNFNFNFSFILLLITCFYSHRNLVLTQVSDIFISFLTLCAKSNTSIENGMESSIFFEVGWGINVEKIHSQSQIVCFQSPTFPRDQSKCICRKNRVWVCVTVGKNCSVPRHFIF